MYLRRKIGAPSRWIYSRQHARPSALDGASGGRFCNGRRADDDNDDCILARERSRRMVSSCCLSAAVAQQRHGQQLRSTRTQQQQQKQQLQLQLHRPARQQYYHTTPHREILPLILATVVVGGGYYSYRAVQRMNTEWEDYQWALQEYERQQLKNATESAAAVQPKTVAIDLGTSFTKLATTHPAVEVAVSREGDRAFFNGVVYDDHTDPSAVTSRGRGALERFYFPAQDREVDVTLPFTVLAAASLSSSDASSPSKAQQVVSDVLTPALTELLDRVDVASTTNDDSNKNESKKEIRKVIATPSAFVGSSVYENAFATLLGCAGGTSHRSNTSFVPEPVAAIWGAQFQNELPETIPKDASILVVDVGGWTTQVAVVRNDVVQHASTLPFGGETIVEQLVDILKGTAPNEPLQDARSLALLQVQARHAVQELSTQTRVHVHVPYLFADPARHHLDTRVARPVLEQAVQAHVRDVVVELLHDSDELSPHFPPPIDLTSLWTSVLTQVLERSAVLPTKLDRVLLVGGGAKSPLVQSTVSAALEMLIGSSEAAAKLPPMANPAVRSELTVLGAATLLPSFDYSVHDGLV